MNFLKKLSDKVIRKFTEILDASNWQIKSNCGWNDIKTINKTIPYDVYILKFKSGRILECADNHILIDEEGCEIFAKDCLGEFIKTDSGCDRVVSVIYTGRVEEMYDFSLEDYSNHLYYANGILSHNTTLMTIYALWLANFYSDQNIIICADKANTATMIFERIRLAYKELPGWIKCPAEEFNKRSMKLTNGSTIVTSATTDSAIRGNTVSCLIIDEFAFVDPNIAEKFWTSVTPTLVTNPNAKMFVSSTPNGVGNMFWSLCDRSERKLNDFKLQKVVWSDIPGRDEKWKKKTIETEMNGDVERFEQEYNCKFVGASASPFNPEVFDFIEKSIKEPIKIEDDGNFKIWDYPKENRVYSIGVDVAEGIGKDSSVIQVFDLTDLYNIQQVATYRNNKINTTDFTEKVLEICEMYGNPLLSVERNGCGTDVCQRLYQDHRYRNFICHGQKDRKDEIKRPGVICTNNTKSPAVTNMKYWLCDKLRVHIRDEMFLHELRHFEKKKNNRWGAEEKYHDDVIMSSVWALNVLHRNLIKRYLIVEKTDADGKPMEVKNKFEYKLSKSYDGLISSKFSKSGRFPVIYFGRHTDKGLYDKNNSSNALFAATDDATFEALRDEGWREIENMSFYNKQWW